MKTLNFLLFPSLIFLFWVFLKIGLVFFGGGYVIIPIAHTELVTNLSLLTEKQFADGVIMSQLAPGPIAAILATFIGYCLAGVWGSLVSIFALFLPGAALMSFLTMNYEKMQNSEFLKKINDTLIPVIIGLLIATAWKLRGITITDNLDILEIIVAIVLIVRYKINPLLIVLAYILVYFFIYK